MELRDLIFSFIPRLSSFSYSGYPPAFEAFEQEAAPFFAAITPENAEEQARDLIAGLEALRSTLGRREAKMRAENEKQVLALFLTPAALRRGGNAAVFSEALNRLWNEQYPRNCYYPGTFETIMKGFDANLLGLPLRKKK